MVKILTDVNQIICRLREWRSEIGASGELAADRYVKVIRDEIEANLEHLDLSDAELERQVSKQVAESINLALGDVNDTMRPLWWRLWDDDKTKREVRVAV